MVAIANDPGVPARARGRPNGRDLPGRKQNLMFHDKHSTKHKPDRAKADKPPKRHVKPRRVRDCAAIAEYEVAVEPALPVGALLEIGDWVLDLARSVADDDEHGAATVERVRAYLHDRVQGRAARAPTESDLLTTLALAVAAVEQRHGVAGLGELVAIGLDADVRVVPRAARSRCRMPRSPRLVHHRYCEP